MVLSLSHMRYSESIGFNQKFGIVFAQIMFITDKKSKNVEKSYKTNFRLSRAVAAAVDRKLCPTFNLDHKI
jgi:hypothetical protein